MSIRDDQKAKFWSVSHFRILEHGLQCAGHGFTERCLVTQAQFGLPVGQAPAQNFAVPAQLDVQSQCQTPIRQWKMITMS